MKYIIVCAQKKSIEKHIVVDVEDFRECEELVERAERNSNEKDEYKNCDTCKCNLCIEGISLCCIPEVARAFKEKK